MADVLLNRSDILRHFMVRSSTKDSLLLSWEVVNGFTAFVHGYRVRYQAIGSAIVQDSPLLSSTRNSFDITQLHENTVYGVCLKVFTNMTSHAESCLRTATSTHSLSVALGSTFGAFLALGVVVMFVLLAKWQHFRRNRKQFQQHILTADSAESIDDLCIIQENGDIELNCLEVCPSDPEVSGAQPKDDGSSPTSEFSADVILHGASVCSVDPGPGSQGSDGTRGQRVLIGLDGYSCVNSFILTSPSRDSKTGGVSYNLLVPLPASGVLPFLMQQEQVQGHEQNHDHGREEASSNSTASIRPGVKVKHQHPVVRLKLRKHPTIDYSSTDEVLHHKATNTAQHRSSAYESEQSCDQTTATTAATTDATDATDALHTPATVQLNENNHAGSEGVGPDCNGSEHGKGKSAASNCLLNSSTGCDALPRSISNTW